MIDTLTSIEKKAIELDQYRKTRLKEQEVDFDAYMKTRQDEDSLVRPAESYQETLHKEFFGEYKEEGLDFPWLCLRDKFRIRPGELTIWSGYNGHMKSMVTGFLMLHLCNAGEKVCIASFEMKPRKTLKRMCIQAVTTPTPTEEYVNRFLNMVSGRLWLYDHQSEIEAERILGVIYYCAEQLGVTQFVVDSLMKVVKDEDDYNGQKRFIGKLTDAAMKLNIHIHLITHAKKAQDESRIPGKQGNKGSGAIVDQTDNFVSVFRKKFDKPDDALDESGKPKPDFFLSIEKQRHGEWEGKIALWFDERSLQFKEHHAAKPIIYVA